MEFEQYLYGRVARDAARAGSRGRRPPRIGRLILGAALALVCLGSMAAVFGPDTVVRTAPAHVATADPAGAPMTLVASQTAVVVAGR